MLYAVCGIRLGRGMEVIHECFNVIILSAWSLTVFLGFNGCLTAGASNP